MLTNFFSVGVKQTGNYVHITGVSYKALERDISKFYSTSLLNKYQIRRESWDTIKVHNFFLVELYEILRELLQLRTMASRRRDLAELRHLLETETWIKDTVNPSGVPFDFSKLDRFRTKLFPEQRMFLEQYPLLVNSFHLKGFLLDAVPGSGKAMPLDTKVKIPGGWKAIGDLKIGDLVIGPKGNTTTVTGVYPQGETDVYRFILEDGRTVDSHPLHLWEVVETDFEGGVVDSRTAVTTTLDIVNHFSQFTYHLPMVGEIGGIDLSSTTDCLGVAQTLLRSDVDIGSSVLELPYNDRFNIAKAMLEASGIQLDGKLIAFSSNGHQAAENFRDLIWSLGGRGVLGTHEGKSVCWFYHREVVALVNNLIVGDVGLTINLEEHQRTLLAIRAVHKIDPEETACISIDSEDKLFVVEDYVVTHNTFTSLVWSQLVSDAPTFVLAPLNVVDEVWVKEFVKHFKTPPKVWTTKSGLVLKEGYDYYIVHHDYLQREGFNILLRFLETYCKNNKVKPKLIIDESHNFNEIKAKQTQRLIQLADANVFSDTLPMSGTLFKALGSELFPMQCLIDKHFDGIARQFFMASYGRNRPALMTLLAHRIGKVKFTIPELVGMGAAPPFEIVKVQVPGSDKYTLDAIRLQMQMYIAERVKFYNHHLPEFITFYNDVIARYESSIRKHPQELEQLRRYKAIVHRFQTQGYNNFTDAQDSVFCKEVEVDIERGLKGKELADFRNVKSAVKYLGLKLRGEALGNVLGRARINAIKDMIEYADLPKYIDNVEKKTVIFTSYVESLQLTNDHLRAKGYNPVMVYGATNHERDMLVEQFKTDPGVNPLGATYSSLKEGYPLLMANQIISLDAPYRDGEIKQVQARVWRTGQDTQCFFWMLDLDTGTKLNITTRSLDILAWSRDQVDALLGRLNTPVAFTNVTGQEMLDLSEEPSSKPLKSSNSVLSLFN